MLAGQPLIGLYLQGDGDPRDVAITMAYGSDYLRVMLLGLLPFALASAYSSTLRETGQTMVPMVGGIVAVFVNLALNYVLIFGHFGLPAMGSGCYGGFPICGIGHRCGLDSCKERIESLYPGCVPFPADPQATL